METLRWDYVDAELTLVVFLNIKIKSAFHVYIYLVLPTEVSHSTHFYNSAAVPDL